MATASSSGVGEVELAVRVGVGLGELARHPAGPALAAERGLRGHGHRRYTPAPTPPTTDVASGVGGVIVPSAVEIVAPVVGEVLPASGR